MEKRKLEAMVTKFLKKLAIIMLKKPKKHWMPHPFLKNRSDPFESPCMYKVNDVFSFLFFLLYALLSLSAWACNNELV